MRVTALALLGWILLVGCRDKAGPAVVPLVEAAPVAVEHGKWALTRPMLDGYLRYQRTLLVQAGKLKPPSFDGGALKKFEEPSVEQKADLDERARLEAGLTPDDVLQIEAMLGQVSARKMTFRLMNPEDVGPTPPRVPDESPAPAVPGLDREAQERAARASHDAVMKAMAALTDERAAFGSANIDVLLQQEDELLKNWALMMEVPELIRSRR